MKTTKTIRWSGEVIDLSMGDVARLLIGKAIREKGVSIRVTKISAIRFFVGGILALIRFFIFRGDLKFESGGFVDGGTFPGAGGRTRIQGYDKIPGIDDGRYDYE